MVATLFRLAPLTRGALPLAMVGFGLLWRDAGVGPPGDLAAIGAVSPGLAK
jgi:ATP-binding cassette subfamily B protein